jgi:hypothetical protein
VVDLFIAVVEDATSVGVPVGGIDSHGYWTTHKHLLDLFAAGNLSHTEDTEGSSCDTTGLVNSFVGVCAASGLSVILDPF